VEVARYVWKICESIDSNWPVPSEKRIMNMGEKKYVYYAKTFFNSKELKWWANKYLEKLPPDVKGLVSRGSSGCAIASAMCVLSERPLTNLVIRKPNERAHGEIAGTLPSEPVAIVDDFISDGITMEAILAEMRRKTPEAKLVCIIVEYSPALEFKWQDKIIPIILVREVG
jgi:orotate phosphoribosyltransferase